MKRALSWIILLIVLTGCERARPRATDLLAKLLSMPNTPQMEVYFEGAMHSEVGYLSAETEEMLYDGQSPKALSDEYAIALCRDDQVYEIHIYHALDAQRAEQIEHILARRQLILQKQENYLYDPENPGAGAVIWRREKWVCLLVTTDNDNAKDIIRHAV